MPELYGNYQSIFNFIERQYYQSPVYSLGHTCYLQEDFRRYIILWYAWYHGYVDDFHNYTVYNGRHNVRVDRNTLQMAKKLCEDKADLLLNEKVDIKVPDENVQEMLDMVFDENKFKPRANELMEKMNAMGTGAFHEFVYKDKVCIDYITTEKIIPLTVINGQVIDCAFASNSTYKDKKVVYLNVHIRLYPLDREDEKFEESAKARAEMGIPVDYDGYIVENRILETNNGRYVQFEGARTEMVDWMLTNSTVPFFQIVKPAKADNICFDDNGLGLSCYSNALHQLIAVDTVYDSYVNEFDLGRKRMFVHDDLAQIDFETEDGENVLLPMFDKRDTVFYSIDLGAEEKIHYVDPVLRIDEHEKGLNRMLNLLGFKCGFGNNYYKFEGGVLKTATEVISENNPLYKSVKKDQHILRDALKNVVKAIIVINNQLMGTSMDEGIEVSVDFDDSIFEDKPTLMKNAMLELNNGIIDEVEYRMRIYKETEEQAMAEIQKMRERSPEPENVDMMGGGA